MGDTSYPISIPGPTRRRRGSGTTRVIQLAAPLVSAAALVGLWQLWTTVGDVSPAILPEPVSVARAMADSSGDLLPATWTTIKEIVIGFAIAVTLGLAAGILIVAFRPVELTIYPILVASQVIPKIAIAPLIFVWLGLTQNAVLTIVVLLSFFPVVIASVGGLKSLEPHMLHLARSVGASGLRTFVVFRIPHALPDVFGGLKLAAARAVTGAVIAEFISTGEGLGRSILLATFQQRPDIALAGIAYLVIVGLGFFFVLSGVERVAIPWHVSVRGAAR